MTWLAALGASRGRIAALAAVAGVALGLPFAGAGGGVRPFRPDRHSPGCSMLSAGRERFYLLYLACDAWRESTAPTGHARANRFCAISARGR